MSQVVCIFGLMGVLLQCFCSEQLWVLPDNSHLERSSVAAPIEGRSAAAAVLTTALCLVWCQRPLVSTSIPTGVRWCCPAPAASNAAPCCVSQWSAAAVSSESFYNGPPWSHVNVSGQQALPCTARQVWCSTAAAHRSSVNCLWQWLFLCSQLADTASSDLSDSLRPVLYSQGRVPKSTVVCLSACRLPCATCRPDSWGPAGGEQGGSSSGCRQMQPMSLQYTLTGRALCTAPPAAPSLVNSRSC